MGPQTLHWANGGVCLETTGAETLRIRAGLRGPESSWGEGSGPKGGGAALKRYLKACLYQQREQNWSFLFGGETALCFGLKTYYILIKCVYNVSPGVNEHTLKKHTKHTRRSILRGTNSASEDT